MPYVTGIANSAADLCNAVVSLATDHGWRWDNSNHILCKGDINGQVTSSDCNLLVQLAIGYSGNTLVSPAPQKTGITDRLGYAGNTLLSYPLTYHIFVHTAPDEIIVAVNYQLMWWQWLALGQANSFGVPGNAVWQWGSTTSDMKIQAGIALNVDGSSSGGYYGHTSGAPFWQPNDGSGVPNSSIYLNVNGHGWWNNSLGYYSKNPNNACASIAAAPLLMTQPNTWNGEAVLIRLHIMVAQPSSFWSLVAELPHLRMLRNDYISDGQILTIGAERWFIAPVYRKNTVSRNTSVYKDATHSGTIAIAVRYDGP